VAAVDIARAGGNKHVSAGAAAALHAPAGRRGAPPHGAPPSAPPLLAGTAVDASCRAGAPPVERQRLNNMAA